MKCSIHINEPAILCEAKSGDLFVVLQSGEGECVCARLDSTLAPITSHFVAGKETLIRCVVIGCRVDEGEVGFHPTGMLLNFMQDTPIAYVEQIEQAAFRTRQEQPTGPLATPLFDKINALSGYVESLGKHIGNLRAALDRSQSVPAEEKPKPGDRM